MWAHWICTYFVDQMNYSLFLFSLTYFFISHTAMVVWLDSESYWPSRPFGELHTLFTTVTYHCTSFDFCPWQTHIFLKVCSCFKFKVAFLDTVTCKAMKVVWNIRLPLIDWLATRRASAKWIVQLQSSTMGWRYKIVQPGLWGQLYYDKRQK